MHFNLIVACVTGAREQNGYTLLSLVEKQQQRRARSFGIAMIMREMYCSGMLWWNFPMLTVLQVL